MVTWPVPETRVIEETLTSINRCRKALVVIHTDWAAAISVMVVLPALRRTETLPERTGCPTEHEQGIWASKANYQKRKTKTENNKNNRKQTKTRCEAGAGGVGGLGVRLW